MDKNYGDELPLRILHVLRAPIGGLWRHVVDLTREQVKRGHDVGIIADASTGGQRADDVLRELAPLLRLGVSRVTMRRNPHPSDLLALAHITRRIVGSVPDVVHGHGSKGGMFARLALAAPGQPRPVRVYTPHGGSLNYNPGTALHRLYMRAEAALQRRTDLILFESGYVASRYEAYVGKMPAAFKVVHNGIAPHEFEPITEAAEATDLLYVGELRAAKGIDTLLASVSRAGQFLGIAPSLTLVGSGPERADLGAQASALGLDGRVVFRDPMPAREAFRLGRLLIVPSRAESLPYIVLEAAGAALPIVATDVGGIPEIFGPMRHRLIPPNSVPALTERLINVMTMAAEYKRAGALSLREHVYAQFSTARMVDGVLSGYREVRAAKHATPVVISFPAALAQ